MDILLHADSREKMIFGLHKLRMGLTYVEDGQTKVVRASKEHSTMEFPYRVKTPVQLDSKNNIIKEPVFHPGYFLALRLYGSMISRFRAALPLPSELSLRNLYNPEQEEVV